MVCLFLAANRHLVKIHEESCKTVGGFKSLTDFKSWVRKVQDHLISKSIALTANAAVEGGSSSSGGSGSTPGLNTARSSALVGSSAIRTAIQGLSPALNDRTASPSSKSPAVSAKLTPNQKLNNTFVTKTPFSGDSPSSSTLSNSNQNISDPEPHFKTLCLKTGSADLLRHVVELHKVFWPRYISSLTLGEQNLLRHNPDHEFWCSQIVYACSKAINVSLRYI